MKKILLRDYILVQLTDYGREYLERNYAQSFIDNCILSNSFIIEGEVWYKMRVSSIFDWFGSAVWNVPPTPLKQEIVIE